ncbi:hypothetical protein OF83DRAFT_693534 [Amylostereum chailletii]|nr:hypothetical protein OF83DRAFT_693534 [Amylostereum chailletii]
MLCIRPTVTQPLRSSIPRFPKTGIQPKVSNALRRLSKRNIGPQLVWFATSSQKRLTFAALERDDMRRPHMRARGGELDNLNLKTRGVDVHGLQDITRVWTDDERKYCRRMAGSDAVMCTRSGFGNALPGRRLLLLLPHTQHGDIPMYISCATCSRSEPVGNLSANDFCPQAVVYYCGTRPSNFLIPVSSPPSRGNPCQKAHHPAQN